MPLDSLRAKSRKFMATAQLDQCIEEESVNDRVTEDFGTFKMPASPPEITPDLPTPENVFPIDTPEKQPVKEFQISMLERKIDFKLHIKPVNFRAKTYDF